MNNRKPCVDWAEQLARKPEDLSPADREALQAHLATCPDCTQTLNDYRLLITRLRTLPRPAARPLPQFVLEGSTPEADQESERGLNGTAGAPLQPGRSGPSLLLLLLARRTRDWQDGAAPDELANPRNGPGTPPGFRPERGHGMQLLFRTGQRWSARATALVAVALLVGLIGGLTLSLLLVHQTGTGAPRGSHPHHTGAIQEFALPGCSTSTDVCGSTMITRGPDGNLWFAESDGNKIVRITPGGSIKAFPIPTASSNPYGITRGPDGNLWFVESSGNKIGRITPSGSIAEFALPAACIGDCNPRGITSGPDGNLWFTEADKDKIGRITPSGTIQEFALPAPCGGASCQPFLITLGPDGNLWFTELLGNKIGRISPAGSIQEFPIPNCGGLCNPADITSGPDGNLWFTILYGNAIGRITPAGSIEQFPLSACSSACDPAGITSGPDGNLWFAEQSANKIGRMTPAGTVQEFALPTGCYNLCTPYGITSGPDGNLWFTENNADRIGRISP